jgi:hypothetical protein
MKHIILITGLVLIVFTSLHGQNNSKPIHNQELWFGYITSIHLTKQLYLWNDFHFVPNTFFVTRHGISYRPNKHVNLTGGYAWVTTSTSFSNQLIRQEHRPWGQIELNATMSPRSSYRFRIRYDARFRKRLEFNEVLDEYLFYNRLRFMNSYRVVVKKFSPNTRAHFNVMNELLFNIGSEVNNFRVDQNRVYVLAGFDVANLTILAGYHNRYIPASGSAAVLNHGFTLWLVQTFGKKKEKIITPEEVPQLY